MIIYTYQKSKKKKRATAKQRELRAQFDGLSKAQRERAIKDALAARGVNQKISSFIPQDIDPTEESVSKWLEANADVFGINVESSQAVPNTDPADIAAYKKLTQTAEAGFTPEAGQDIMQRLMNANSKEELDAVIRESGL